jgi:hypothetical protein
VTWCQAGSSEMCSTVGSSHSIANLCAFGQIASIPTMCVFGMLWAYRAGGGGGEQD